MRYFLLWAFLSVFPTFAVAQSRLAACEPALAVRDIKWSESSRQTRLAWLRIINEVNYEQFKQSAKASVPGYFDGDYRSFNEKRRSNFSKEKYQSDDFQAQQELAIVAPREAVAAWAECVKANSNDLFVYSRDVDARGATIAVNWRPPPGLQQLTNVRFRVNGIKRTHDITSARIIPVGENFFAVERLRLNEPIRGTISGMAGGRGVYSGPIYIPAVMPPDPPPIPVSPPPQPKAAGTLFVGQTPNCNASIITNHVNHLNCVNTPYGNVADAGPWAQQTLYLGVQANVNAGVVTTKVAFKGGQTRPYGFTLLDADKLSGSQRLFVVVGCGSNDGEVTSNPGHKNCQTVPIGWTYP
jgi:hypothetical protein